MSGTLISFAAISIILLVTFLALRTVSEHQSIFTRPRDRLIMGIPWVTLLTATICILMFFFIQTGRGNGEPLVVGFRSWSLWYPQGIILSTFAHLDTAHLISNVTGIIVFGAIIEYTIGHYPPHHTPSNAISPLIQRIPTLKTPLLRILGLTGAVLGYAIGSSVLLPGATLGISGLVFVLFGIAVVMKPRIAIIGVIVAEILGLLAQAIIFPVSISLLPAGPAATALAEISIHGHLFGFVVGALLGMLLVRRRGDNGDLVESWFAALAIAVLFGLYAVTWPSESGDPMLFTAVGTVLVFTLALLISLLIDDGNIMFINYIDLSARETALGLLLAAVLAFAAIGIPYNLVAISDDGQFNNQVEVEDYIIGYDEDVIDQYTAALMTPGIGPEDGAITVSGVIVVSDERNAWHVAASERELRHHKRVEVPVGDATWREDVVVTRTDWIVLGSAPVYQVHAEVNNDTETLYTSEQIMSPHLIDGKSITIKATSEEFQIIVQGDGQSETAAIPSEGGNVTVNGVEFERVSDRLRASSGDTQIVVARYSPPP